MQTETRDETLDEASQPSVVLPWWRSKLNLISVAVAIALVCSALGWVVGNNRAVPDPSRIDIGFLQDMQPHHDQAQQMAFIYLNKDDGRLALRDVARSILVSQGIEVGRMLQLLHSFGAPEANETDTAMSWMGEPTPTERMPGMATQSDIDRLVAATGPEADEIFVQLMIAHHQGGIHMSEYALAYASVGDVRALADLILKGQTDEIAELTFIMTP